MESNTPFGTEAWVGLISTTELPALTSTVQRLEQISHSDTASLANLGQSILHDHALTSKVLRVANNTRMGRNKVTTVSRATVILGVETIKSICITAKIITSLLKNKDLSAGVYQRLLKLMAHSFQSAMLAKMMSSNYDEQTQEEIFIAALLHRIGETAFWSLGGKVTVELDKSIKLSPDKESMIVEQALGTSFNDISIGLAKTWQYGEFLTKSLDEPQSRTKEMQIVALADKLSETIISPEKSPYSMSILIKECAGLMGQNEAQVQNKLKQCSADTLKQLQSYGAKELMSFVKTDIKDAIYHEISDDFDVETNRALLQMDMLRELAMLALEKVDLNQIIHTAMEGISRGIGFERTIVLFIDAETYQLIPRFVTAKNSEHTKQDFIISLRENSIFRKILKDKKPIHIDKDSKSKIVQDPNFSVVCERGFCIAPLIVADRCIGMIYGDFLDSNLPVAEDEYKAFNHFVLQTNLALTIISQR